MQEKLTETELLENELNNNIIQDYINNMSIKCICKKYKIGDRKLYRLVKGINRLDKRYINISKNKDFEYYLIGLIASDGCIYENKNRIEISIHINDVDIIKLIASQIGISYYIENNRKSPRARVLFTSKDFLKKLLDIGVIPRKSKDMCLDISKIDSNYIYAFVRGYFDGDGSIYLSNSKSKLHKDKKLKRVNIVGNKDTMVKIQNILRQSGISSNINLLCKSGTHVSFDFYALRIYKQDDIVLFKNFIYNNSTIFLKRKYDKFNAV